MSRLIILVIIPIAGLMNACKREACCPERTELGQLSWSSETENWFPSKYLNQSGNLKFESEQGEIVSFQLGHSDILEGHFESFDMQCENGEGTTSVSWANRRYSGRFLTPDSSIAISVGIGVWNEKLSLSDVTEADYYEWILISVYRLKGGTGGDFGRIRIVTDLRNAELDEIDHAAENYEKLENLEFLGKVFPEIYQDNEPDFPNSNIYFEKGKGLVGFIDDNGVKWKLKE